MTYNKNISTRFTIHFLQFITIFILTDIQFILHLFQGFNVNKQRLKWLEIYLERHPHFQVFHVGFNLMYTKMSLKWFCKITILIENYMSQKDKNFINQFSKVLQIDKHTNYTEKTQHCWLLKQAEQRLLCF